MIKILLLLITLFSASLESIAQNTITATFENIDHELGTVRVGLYKTEDSFLGKPYLALVSKIKNGKAEVIFKDIPDGVYAISGFHDEDGNGKLNMVMGLIPSEPYGCSNNAPSRFGPPNWKDAKFEVKNGEVVQQKISL
ncbi:MAG: DUF2141 domain-containing protein [Leeuwenhoekiella sp.]